MNWHTRDGGSIPVSEMKTEHIQYAMARLKRQGYVSPKTVASYLSCRLPQGDMALPAYEQELEAALDAPSTIFIDLFEEELKKRGATLQGQ